MRCLSQGFHFLIKTLKQQCEWVFQLRPLAIGALDFSISQFNFASFTQNYAVNITAGRCLWFSQSSEFTINHFGSDLRFSQRLRFWITTPCIFEAYTSEFWKNVLQPWVFLGNWRTAVCPEPADSYRRVLLIPLFSNAGIIEIFPRQSFGCSL